MRCPIDLRIGPGERDREYRSVAHQPVALDQMRVRGPEAAAWNRREPLRAIEADRIDDERLSFPARDRITHRGRVIDVLADVSGAIEKDVTRCGDRFEVHHDLAATLADIDWPGGIHRRRHAYPIAPARRVLVLLAL